MLLIIQLIKVSTFFVFVNCQIISSNWTPVTMRTTNVDGYNLVGEESRKLSLGVILNGCNANPLCSTVCLVGDVYKHFENTIDADYCESKDKASYQCWSSQAFEFGTKLSDGLHYKLKQKVYLVHDEARQCCRRTLGYHMALLKTPQSFTAARNFRASSGFKLFVHLDLQLYPGPHGIVRWGDGSYPHSSFGIERNHGAHTTPTGVQINYHNDMINYPASYRNPVLCQQRVPTV